MKQAINFNIPGKSESVELDNVPRLNEHVNIWNDRWIVFDVTYYVKDNYISVGLYPSKD